MQIASARLAVHRIIKKKKQLKIRTEAPIDKDQSDESSVEPSSLSVSLGLRRRRITRLKSQAVQDSSDRRVSSRLQVR